MVFDPSAQKVRFGQIAQAANPQVSDPNQNRNLSGLPAVKKQVGNYNDSIKALNITTSAQPPSTMPAPPRFSGTTGGIMLPDAGLVSLAEPPTPNPPDPRRISGRYAQGGYEPISENKQWSGTGYSGPDPREAAAPEAAPAQTPPPLGRLVGRADKCSSRQQTLGSLPLVERAEGRAADLPSQNSQRLRHQSRAERQHLEAISSLLEKLDRPGGQTVMDLQ